MAHNPFGHVDLRVQDRAVARAFYLAFLPELGLSVLNRGKNFDTLSCPGLAKPLQPWFGWTEDPAHVPNGNRIAFQVASRAEVDRLAALLGPAGAREISGPKAMPEYSAGYYAVFFADPSGNPLEIVHCPD
ncbi:MAG TPA: VOC family protein [Planctomycetota bacterium]